MLEIIAIIFLTKKLAEVAESKGRGKGWAALGPVLWILGEITGGIAGVIVFGDDGAGMYLLAIVGALVGAGISWAVVNGLSAGENAFDGSGMDGGYSFADPNNPYSPPGYGNQAPGGYQPPPAGSQAGGYPPPHSDNPLNQYPPQQ